MANIIYSCVYESVIAVKQFKQSNMIIKHTDFISEFFHLIK